MNFPDRVSSLLQQKGNQVFSIPSDASVYSAIELMAEKNVGGLLVIDRNCLVGIVSERDYMREVILKGRSLKNTPVREIMTQSPITIGPEITIDEAVRIMSANHIRHVPVVDYGVKNRGASFEGHVAGVLSMRDLLNSMASSQREAIEHMEHSLKTRSA
jgi:CBS domain-containing protein